MKMEIKWFLCEKLQFLPLKVRGLLVPEMKHRSSFHSTIERRFFSSSRWKTLIGRWDSQLNYDRPGFDLVHFHEGKTLCAGEPLFGFVVLEFKEDSCSWKKCKRTSNVKGGYERICLIVTLNQEKYWCWPEGYTYCINFKFPLFPSYRMHKIFRKHNLWPWDRVNWDKNLHEIF